MRQTEHYGLTILELSDPLSVKPLNENAETIDVAMHTMATALPGKAMMACGSYTGDGTRSVTINTPGFRPKAVLMRKNTGVVRGNLGTDQAMTVIGGWCLWIGANMQASYGVYARADEVSGDSGVGDLRQNTISKTITFTAGNESLSWSVPALPSKYYDVREDEGPNVVNNTAGTVYEWIAFGTAE